MSFKSKILIFIILLLVVSLSGTLALSLSNTQAFLEKQLQSHANDTATSLGLSLSSVADINEPSSMQTMIDAVFDRGHFAQIALSDMNGAVIYKRTSDEVIEGIPHWFVDSIEIVIPEAEAVVQSGWMPIGNLEVQASTGYAYIELWLTFKQISQWFVLTACLFLATAYTALQMLLKPLQRVTQQAGAIVDKQYIIQKPIPRTTEFRQLVMGMNEMVSQLEQVFSREAKIAEKLRTIAYQDAHTGLHNKYYFDTIFNSLLNEHESTAEGSMCLLEIKGLQEVNDHYGFQLGNDLIKFVADQLKSEFSEKNSMFVRLNSTELMAILPGKQPIMLESSLNALLQSGEMARQHFNLDGPTIDLAAAVVAYQPGQTRASTLSRLSNTLQRAKTVQPAYAIETTGQSASGDSDAWSQKLTTAIAAKSFQLYKQASYSASQHVHDNELLIRMRDDKGNLLSAAYFMPAVEALQLQIEIDELVIQLAQEYLSPTEQESLYAINLCPALLENADLIGRLEPTLQKAKGLNLAFEFSESAIAHNLEDTRSLFNRITALGFAVGIDRFGMHTSNLRYLQELRPSYIKLDGAFSERIESDEQTRSYVASIVDSASSLDINVIATAVENEGQQYAFSELGIHYFQGYLFEAPSPL